MANRDTSSNRQRARKRAGGRAPSSVPPRARARTRDDAEAAQDIQAEWLQGVQQVWLAGMGALARAQKDGPGAFTDAVVEGLKLLGQSRSAAQRLMRGVFETAQAGVQSRVGGARSQAQETWDNLESLFQSRVQRAMHQVGVPTADEIRVLTRRVAELNENVKQLNARERLRRTATAHTRATGKPARKTARKSARKTTGKAPAADE
ncbi:MAG TPA: phasin family protein [Steroidobacteraceae bacterium]|nr:phasin family protein [Steroidobacteraceae bacterium]